MCEEEKKNCLDRTNLGKGLDFRVLRPSFFLIFGVDIYYEKL